MRKWLLILLLPLSVQAENVVYGTNSLGPTPFAINTAGQITTTLQAGEDQTNNVMRVEGQFSYCLDDADIVCKATPGFLHSVSCWGEDAAATAGRVQIRDSATATGGTVVWQTEFAAAIAPPNLWVADIVMTAGIAIDWDTTADVFCTVTYR